MSAQERADVDALVDALYTGPLDDFVAARDAVVKRVAGSGDRVGAERVKKLTKPTVAAWVANHVAREQPKELEALASIGDELRAATADRDRGRIKALDRLRRERTEALVGALREAGEVDGRPVSASVLDRLAETLTAAVMDADAAAAVRAGRLSQALQYVGFGVVDEGGEPADVVALRTEVAGGERAKGGAAKGDDADGGDGLAAAEREVEEASAEVDRLESRHDDARKRLREAIDAVGQREDEVARLEAEIERLVAERDAARESLDDAHAAEDKARTELSAAEDELDDAEERAAEARKRRREARRKG
ncbi:hypothetical protein L1785_07975 [Antribacter sp. KLBMP9083]|uniref:Uncharacterized protein n=1 Tax=Antribacter soli TaxID=2910976 RepID=A0AA41U6X6_9MICO|nr:hypothetical protein [Antribacter soli]MCF4120916.1 hypothetical protein [Antribacter soli]